MSIRASDLIVSTKKETNNFSNMPISDLSKPWQERLSAIITLPGKKDGNKFLNEVVLKAFNELKEEFAKNGLEAKVTNGENFVNLNVGLGDEMDFRYGVYLTKSHSPDYTRELDGDDLYYRAEVYLKEGGQDYDVLGWSEATLINDVIEQYRKHMQFLHIVRE